MGLEPSFSGDTLVWPLAGTGMLPPEPNDPTLVIPHGALQVSLRDMTEQRASADIDLEPRLAPSEPMGGAPARAPKTARKWPIAIVASCLLHAALAVVLLAAPQVWHAPQDPTQIEGADQAGVMLVGNADNDQLMAGDVTKVTLVPVVNAKPIETMEAQAVTADEAIQPVEQTVAQTPATETLEPLTETTTPVAAERLQPETHDPVAATTPEPEILASDAPQSDAGNVVQKAVQAPSTDPVEGTRAPAVQTTETVTAEDIPTPKAVEAIPEPRPVEQPVKPKPVMQAKDKARDEPVKPLRKKAKAGSGGANQADSRRGVANGSTDGETTVASKGGAASSAVGNAAVSNYPGKIAAKLRRASRNLSRSDQSKASNNAQVSFVISAKGGVEALRLVKSSGSPGLDETALAIIKRAAPFPPIPPEAGRSSWAFTLPIGPF